jgi:hypothetical protein
MVKFAALALASVLLSAANAAKPVTDVEGTNSNCGGEFVCPETVKFVCGEDGRTYLNPCVAKCVGSVEAKYKGVCQADLDELNEACKVNNDKRIDCLAESGCSFTSDGEGGLNGDGFAAETDEQSSLVACWSVTPKVDERKPAFRKRCEEVGEGNECEFFADEFEDAEGNAETFFRCERLGCHNDLNSADCLERGCKVVTVSAACYPISDFSADKAEACFANDESNCDQGCEWIAPSETCAADTDGGTIGYDGSELYSDGGGQLDGDSAESSCFGWVGKYDSDGKPIASPNEDAEGRTLKAFCEGVTDAGGTSICAFTKPENGIDDGFCNSENPCSKLTDATSCQGNANCEMVPDADGNFAGCVVKVLGGGDSMESGGGDSCPFIKSESNCKAEVNSNGEKQCAWTTQKIILCNLEGGGTMNIGPDDPCDGEKTEEEDNQCSNICQASGKDKTTCQSAGCCYNTVDEETGQGFCFSKVGGECKSPTDFDIDSDTGDFMGPDGGVDGDGGAVCFAYMTEGKCLEKKSEEGSKLPICMWNENSYSMCNAKEAEDDSKCAVLTDDACESSAVCNLKVETSGFCTTNDPCNNVEEENDCKDLEADGCSWQGEAGGGFCIVSSNVGSFEGLVTKGTCAYDSLRDDADSGAAASASEDLTELDLGDGFASGDACYQAIDSLSLSTDAEIATAEKTCGKARDINGNQKCKFVNLAGPQESCYNTNEEAGLGEGEADVVGGVDDGSITRCYNYYDESECSLFGSEDCTWGIKEDDTDAGGNALTPDYACEEIVLSAVEKCSLLDGKHSCEDSGSGCAFAEVIDAFGSGAAGPGDGADLAGLTGGSDDDFASSAGLGAACEKGGQDGAVACGEVKDKDGKALCAFTSTTTKFCTTAGSPGADDGAGEADGPPTAPGGDEPGGFSDCSMKDAEGDDSECAKADGCEVESQSYGRCTPKPHKCTEYDADECQKDSDCKYNPPDMGLCVEKSDNFFNLTDVEKAASLACRCLDEDAIEHYNQDKCEAAGCEFYANTAGPAPGAGGAESPDAFPGGDYGGGSSSQMCTPRDQSSQDEDADVSADDFEIFDECKCIEDENADGCAEANTGIGGNIGDGGLGGGSVCDELFIEAACEGKKLKTGDKACDWQATPAMFACTARTGGFDDYCNSQDRYIMSTGQLNVSSCEANSDCVVQKVGDASGFCGAHNPCTPLNGKPTDCAAQSGCRYKTEDKTCQQDLNEFAACQENTCCYDIVDANPKATCNSKKMVDGTRACAWYESSGGRSLCAPKTPDADCPLLDDEGVTAAQCNANDQCAWDEGADIDTGACQPYDPCADGTDSEDSCVGVADGDGKQLCLWYEDQYTNDKYCVSKENSGADSQDALVDLIEGAQDGDEVACTLYFTESACNEAPRGDLPHPKCMYLDDTCLTYDKCRTANANDNEEACNELGCSWENAPGGGLGMGVGVCKKPLGEIDTKSNFKCVPVDAGDISNDDNLFVEFSTAPPTTTLDPKGCCKIEKNLFAPKEINCHEELTAVECADLATSIGSSTGKWTTGTAIRGATCADAAAEGIKLCPQGKTTVFVPTTTTVKTTTPKPYTLVPAEYRIFVSVLNENGAKVLLQDAQDSAKRPLLLSKFKTLLNLPQSILYDQTVNAGKMIFYTRGGIEIRFPTPGIKDEHRPEFKALKAAVRKMNKDATGGRRRRAKPPGGQLSYMKVIGRKPCSYKDADNTGCTFGEPIIAAIDGPKKTFVGAAEGYMVDETDEAAVPTAPVPTIPAVITTKKPAIAIKTLPATTRTRTTTTKTTRFQYTRPTNTKTATTATITTTTIDPAAPTTTVITTTVTIDRSDIGAIEESIEDGATEAPPENQNSNADDAASEGKAKVGGTTIAVIIIVVLLLAGAGGLVIYCMKKKLDVTASDPNYVRGGGTAFKNPAYAPAGGQIDEANEGYLDIQEAAKRAKKPKKKGGLVRQESLC